VPYVFPVPKLVANYLFTDRAFYLLEGRKVQSNRLEQLGFKFEFEDFHKAMDSLQQYLRESNVSIDLGAANVLQGAGFHGANKNNPILTWSPTSKGKMKKII